MLAYRKHGILNKRFRGDKYIEVHAIMISSAEITNEKNVTPEQIVAEAGQIWKKYRGRARNQKEAEDLMSLARTEHREFCLAYPIVARYMIQFGVFSKRAFARFLKKIKGKVMKSEEDWIESQADYVVLLYKSENSHWNATQANNLRANIVAILKEEREAFKKIVKKSEETVEK